MGRFGSWMTVTMLAVITSAVGLALLFQVPQVSNVHGRWISILLSLFCFTVTASPWWALAAAAIARTPRLPNSEIQIRSGMSHR